jgi:tripartite-type tricarboxylate transporter receptor subunit TctC
MGKKIFFFVFSLLVAAAMVAPQGDGAPKFPTKQISYMIPFDPGGQSDREARRQQPLLEKALGQRIIIDYKIGGGGAVGWSQLARAKPDGYYIMGINLPHIILQPLQQECGYKTGQIRPVVFFQGTPLGIAVLKKSPYKTLKDLIAAAKAKPGDISVGGSGMFSGHHVATLRLQSLTGAKFNYVPFTGAAPQMTGFLGGHVVAAMANSDDLVKYRDEIRVLGIADSQRFQALPDAPTFKEAGFDMVEMIARGVGVPAATPEPVVAILEAAFLQVTKNPNVVAAMKKDGFVPLSMGAKESKEFLEKMTVVYKEQLKDIKK